LNTGKVRIIGGRWRGRRISIPSQARPTGDRIRETLFNWLQMFIHDAKVLDLFAGSGVLGFEALSRGAAYATLVDQNGSVVRELQNTTDMLDSDAAIILQATVPSKKLWQQLNGMQFDIVFLDPPFRQGLVLPVLSGLVRHNLLAANAKIYIEVESEFDLIQHLDGWEIVKQKQSGQVGYYLISIMINYPTN